MFVKLERCPICDNAKFQNKLICMDHAVSGESFAIVKCIQCELLITNPRPDPDSLPNYYDSKNYISHTGKGNNLVNFLYKIIRRITIRGKVKLIGNLSTGGKKMLLDIGCGTGNFLDACGDRGWNIHGVEPNEKARKIAENLTGIEIFPDVSSLNSKFDIITLWHVLEHFEDLDEIMKELNRLLHRNGRLVIAVPNHRSLDQNLYKEFWAAWDVPRHMFHFSTETIRKLVRKYQMKIEKVLPMKWDAYYVSMLSEKYIHGHNNYAKSLISGYKSNSYGAKTGEYSSMIFIIKK